MGFAFCCASTDIKSDIRLFFEGFVRGYRKFEKFQRSVDNMKEQDESEFQMTTRKKRLKQRTASTFTLVSDMREQLNIFFKIRGLVNV